MQLTMPVRPHYTPLVTSATAMSSSAELLFSANERGRHAGDAKANHLRGRTVESFERAGLPSWWFAWIGSMTLMISPTILGLHVGGLSS